MSTPRAPLRFFLGGRDLEMQAIRALLERNAPQSFEDAGLAWGAAVSAYAEAIRASLKRGETPVLVELADDLPVDAFDRSRCLVVDHHGALAGADRPTSLEQVLTLLGLPRSAWTREHDLIAANDRGHIRAMRALDPPATQEEIRAIRARDRRAQRVSESDEAEARRAIAGRQVSGRLTIVETAARSSTAVADLMEPVLGGPGYDALLVVMPETLAVFADGGTVRWLADAVPGSWFGGDLPERGFWGTRLPPGPDRDRLIRAHHPPHRLTRGEERGGEKRGARDPLRVLGARFSGFGLWSLHDEFFGSKGLHRGSNPRVSDLDFGSVTRARLSSPWGQPTRVGSKTQMLENGEWVFTVGATHACRLPLRRLLSRRSFRWHSSSARIACISRFPPAEEEPEGGARRRQTLVLLQRGECLVASLDRRQRLRLS